MKISATKARTHLSAVVKAVQAGETFTITKHGRTVAQIEPITRPISSNPK